MAGLGRASALMSAGTLASRLSGLVRTIVLVGLIGSNRSAVADAFSVANQLPNSIFEVLSIGALTAVIVPQIVRASAAPDGGRAFISKLYTLTIVILLAVTGVAMVAAPWLVSLQIPPANVEQRVLATALAYWCLPQIFFYGLYALIGETLNARRVFGPSMWVPVANNIFSTVGFLVLAAVFGENLVNIADWTPAMIGWLGGVATGGIACQALMLMIFWRRTHLSLRVDFRWKGVGLRGLGRAASWTLAMALSSMVASYFQVWVANTASGDGPAVAVMNNAWLIFILPYSVIVHSIGIPYFTKIAEHVVRGDNASVIVDVVRALRILAFFLVGALAVLLAAAIPASRVFTNTAEDAVEAALVLAAYLVALLPLALLYMVHRIFYAWGDTRTPFQYNLLQCALVIGTAATAWGLHAAGILPTTALAATLALGQALANFAQAALALFLLKRRLGVVVPARTLTALVRPGLAGIVAGIAGFAVYLLVGGIDGWMGVDKLSGVLGAGLIAVVAGGIYLGLTMLGRVPEAQTAVGLVRSILSRRRPEA